MACPLVWYVSAVMVDASPPPSWLARAGAWARRPQTAMAAVFVLSAASSVVVLARKHRGTSASFSVHERGAPSNATAVPEGNAVPSAPVEPETTAHAKNLDTPSPVHPRAHLAVAEQANTIEMALDLEQKGHAHEAMAALRELGDKGDFRARFLLGKAEKLHLGCASARETFARLAREPQLGALAWDARLEEGRCARQLGDEDGARRALQTLIDVPSHRERAVSELRELD